MVTNRSDKLFYTARIRLQGPQAYPLHDHEFGEIFWIDEGECVHVINGEEIPMSVGDCVFIRPRDQHAFRGVGRNPFWVVNTCFLWPVYEEIAERYFPQGFDLYAVHEPMPHMLSLDARQLKTARQAFFTLLQAPRARFHIERYLMNLFAELLPLPKEQSLVGPQAPGWMQRAWQQMTHSSEHLRVGVPAFQKLCGRSAEHVSREFHKQTGQTLSQSINRLRMEHAALLLTGTSREIIEIAAECGFESLSHFYFCFRRYHGASPSSLRKRSQQRMYPNVSGA